MLNPMTYSMFCSRASTPDRFATRAFPDTAPTARSANGPTSAATVPGSKTVSPSIRTTMS
jgi:hypothetical protein